jgi:hypothetical protein
MTNHARGRRVAWDRRHGRFGKQPPFHCSSGHRAWIAALRRRPGGGECVGSSPKAGYPAADLGTGLFAAEVKAGHLAADLGAGHFAAEAKAGYFAADLGAGTAGGAERKRRR